MDQNNENKKNQDILKWLVIGLAGLGAIVLIFSFGVFVGGMKARFSYKWAESYHKNFAGPKAGFLGDWRGTFPLPGEFIEGHGAFGEIIKIDEATLIMESKPQDIEKVIVINDDTLLKKGRATINKDELRVGVQIVVIGSPNGEGQIEAKLIRVFDKPDMGFLPGRPRQMFFR